MLNPKLLATASMASLALFVVFFRRPIHDGFGVLSNFSHDHSDDLSSTSASKDVLSSSKATYNRPLIMYAYHESEYAHENIEFFIDQGLHSATDFIFIFNDDTDRISLVPDEPNICIIRRNNTCYDLGAFGEVLKEGNLWKKYRRFITLNASLRGPFTPFWSDQCWSDIYLNKLTAETKVRMDRQTTTS